MPSHDQRAHFPCGLVQAKGALRFGADTLLLASFVHHYCQGPLGRVAELGCGCGAALCALGLLRQELSGLGLEKDPEQCAAARFNLAALGLASNIEILESDFSQEDNYAHLRQSFKLVLANPPYYSPTEGRPCQEQKRNLAMRSFSALELFCKLAS
ncbi:MAG: methyltransferase, partial [Desulfovibrio sp.]|nr:methyltransferase [Desulfovibrio sp.]